MARRRPALVARGGLGLTMGLTLRLLASAPAVAAPPPPAPARDARTITLTDGDKPVELALAPRLLLHLHAAADLPAREIKLSPTWRTDAAGHLLADLADEESGVAVTLRLAVSGAAQLQVEVRYTRRAWVSLAAVELVLPGRAQVLDRDLVMRPAPPIAYLDRFGTKKLRAGAVTALIDDGIDGVVVRTRGDGPEGERARTEVRVEMFSAEARPFLHDARCRADWRADNPKLSRPARLREPGDRDLARVELHADDGPVLAKSRWPEGRAAALAVTDHADQSSPDTFSALTRGRSDAETPVGGLLFHHLVITKSLFLRGETDGDGKRQLEDERFAALTEELARGGSEIIPHSVTPEPDEREATAAGLERFDRYRSATWIDHQPETNCEAFTNQGWRGADDRLGGKWRIADLLARHRYRYIWSARDTDDVDLVAAGHLERRSLTLWPLGRLAPGDPDDRWLFKTSWMHRDQEEFFRVLGPEQLDRLERDRGATLLHTYLESLKATQDPRFAQHNVLRRRGGLIETSPRLEKLFEDLARRIAAGTLWMPTLAALGDWLQQLDRVRVRYAADGSALVSSPVDLVGLTFQIPGDAEPPASASRPLVDVLVDGSPPRGLRSDRAGTVFWFDLKAGRPAKVELRARPVPNADGSDVPGRVVKFVASAHGE